jgi:Tfp pilus assembly protein PilV
MFPAAYGPGPSTPTDRRGFTLLEVIVSIILIDVGLLALLSGTALVARVSFAAELRAAVTQAAQNRVDSLTLNPCDSTAAAGAHPIAILHANAVEHWSRSPRAGALLHVRDSVSYSAWGTPQALVIATDALC